MVLLNFTVMFDKLIRKEKLRTIRKASETNLKKYKPGNLTWLYFNNRTIFAHKLGIAYIYQTTRSHFVDLDEEDAIADGFNNLKELQEFLLSHYGEEYCKNGGFVIIYFVWVFEWMG